MGLAPYGTSKYSDIITNYLIDLKKDGSFKINQEYFSYTHGLKMINKKFESLFKHPARNPQDKLTQFHMDIAASIQEVLENCMLSLTRSIYDEYGIENLCLAGGVALNCVANGKILKDKKFKNIWVQPAAGDAGGALGAALALWFKEFKKSRKTNDQDTMHGSYLGPSFSEKKIESDLIKSKAKFTIMNSEI